MSTPSPASPQERPFAPSASPSVDQPDIPGAPSPSSIDDEPPPLPIFEEPPPLPTGEGELDSDKPPLLRMVDDYAASIVDEPEPLTSPIDVQHESVFAIAPSIAEEQPTPAVAIIQGPPRAHLSITAFIAMLFVPFAFLPGIGVIAAIMIFALSTAVLKATWGSPIYTFSRMLASSCRILALTVIVLQSIYLIFLIYMFFDSYREFMEQVHYLLDIQEDQLNFAKEVWHFFTGNHSLISCLSDLRIFR